MPEYGREYWERHNVDRRLTPEQLVEIAEEHVRREGALVLEANRFTRRGIPFTLRGTVGERMSAVTEPLARICHP